MNAPIGGPITRDRFICTDASETAPGRSSRGTSVGRIALRPGAPSALAMPTANTHDRDEHAATDASAIATAASANENSELRELHADEEPAPIDHVGEQSAEHRQEQQRAELREVQQADERRRAGELVARTRRARRSASTCRCSTRTSRSRRCGSRGGAARPARSRARTRRRRRRARLRPARARARRSNTAGHPTEGRVAGRRRFSAEDGRGADHVLVAQACELVVGHAELARAPRRCAGRASARARSSTRCGPADMRTGHVGYSLLADERVVDRLEEAARLHLRIVERRVAAAPSPRRRCPCARSSARRVVGACASRTTRLARRSSSDRTSRSIATHVVVARASVHAARAAPAEQRRRRSRSGSPDRRSPRSRPRPAAPRRAAPRRCAPGARARRRPRARRARRPSGRRDRRG